MLGARERLFIASENELGFLGLNHNRLVFIEKKRDEYKCRST